MDETLFWSDEQKRLAIRRKEVLGSVEAKFNALLAKLKAKQLNQDANAGELIAAVMPSRQIAEVVKLNAFLAKLKSLPKPIKSNNEIHSMFDELIKLLIKQVDIVDAEQTAKIKSMAAKLSANLRKNKSMRTEISVMLTTIKSNIANVEAKVAALDDNEVDPIIADAVPSVHNVADVPEVKAPKLKSELTKIKSMVAEIEAMHTIDESKVAEVEAKLAALSANAMDPITADAMPVKQIKAYVPEVKKHNAASSEGRHRDRGY
jgi:hypothetical protein